MGIDHHAHTGRDHESQCTGGGQKRSDKPLVIALADHFGAHNGADGCGGGNAGAGNGAEKSASEAAGSADSAGKTSQQHVGKAHQTGGCTVYHDGAGENKQRQGQIGEGVDAVNHLLHDTEDGDACIKKQKRSGADGDGEADRNGQDHTDGKN